MLDGRTGRLLDARLARDQADERLPSIVAGLARDGELVWTGGRGTPTSSACLTRLGQLVGEVIALDVGSFIYTRTPYDPAAPVPGGVAPDAWHGDGTG